MLGRTQELAEFNAILDRVSVNGSSKVIVIEGATGIGKSRLLEELMVYSEVRLIVEANSSCLLMDRVFAQGAEISRTRS